MKKSEMATITGQAYDEFKNKEMSKEKKDEAFQKLFDLHNYLIS